jgi:hypothetical protein
MAELQSLADIYQAWSDGKSQPDQSAFGNLGPAIFAHDPSGTAAVAKAVTMLAYATFPRRPARAGVNAIGAVESNISAHTGDPIPSIGKAASHKALFLRQHNRLLAIVRPMELASKLAQKAAKVKPPAPASLDF